MTGGVQAYPELLYPDTERGVFLRRTSRFTAQVLVGNREESVHLKNTGRLANLLLPGAECTLLGAASAGRKTRYDLMCVKSPETGWVNIDSLAANALVRRMLELGPADRLHPEHTCGDSRFDFYAEFGAEKHLIEVKGCTLPMEGEPGTGIFPDAPTLRGVKHLRELAEAASAGFFASVLFVLQMNGFSMVRPNDALQPAFGEALRDAAGAGVCVLCAPCAVEPDRIRILGLRDLTEIYGGKAGGRAERLWPFGGENS